MGTVASNKEVDDPEDNIVTEAALEKDGDECLAAPTATVCEEESDIEEGEYIDTDEDDETPTDVAVAGEGTTVGFAEKAEEPIVPAKKEQRMVSVEKTEKERERE